MWADRSRLSKMKSRFHPKHFHSMKILYYWTATTTLSIEEEEDDEQFSIDNR